MKEVSGLFLFVFFNWISFPCSAQADSAFAGTLPAAGDSGRIIYSAVDVMPEFPGGMPALQEFLSTQLRYPDAARTAGIQGKVVIRFVVDTDGAISNAQVIRDIGGGCAWEAMRVILQMPAWSPGLKDGKAVPVYMILPVSFHLEEDDYTMPNITTPYQVLSADSLKTIIRMNLVYPKEARKKKIQGEVVLLFEVNESGRPVNIQVFRSLGFGCDEEAIRILELLPDWIPGTRQGKPVTMPAYLGIEFIPAK